jgi:hypothetical protein
MKKLISIIFIIFILSGCEKDNSDYRAKYSGTFEFRDYITAVNPEGGGTMSILYYTGEVIVGEAENDLIINDTLKIVINEDGILEGYKGINGYGEYISHDRFSYDYWHIVDDIQFNHSITAERK